MKKLLFFLFIAIASTLQINASEISLSQQLRKAAREGKLKKVQETLDAGADIESQGDNWHAALAEAAHAGHFETTELLIMRGANINSTNEDNITPVMGATIETARLLLQHRADVNATNYVGSSSLIKAAYEKNSPMVKLLLEHQANLHQKFMSQTALDVARAYQDTVTIQLLEAAAQQ